MIDGKTKKETGGRGKTTFRITDMESCTWYETFLKKEVTPFDSPVSIHIHSKRKRYVDADAVSAKAAIDGLVHAGLLVDDSPAYVKEVSYSQEKTAQNEAEETIITVREL